MKVDAVVLGGGDGTIIDPHCRFKGLMPVAGKPMIEWVVEALRAAESVDGIAVVVPTAENLGPWVDGVDKLVVSGGTVTDNLLAGIRSFRDGKPVLIATGDIPALTPQAVDDFVKASFESDAQLAYPFIRQEDMLAQFPGSERTYVRLADGRVTGGNLAFALPEVIEANVEMGQKLFDLRKNAVAMARLIGLRFMFRLVTGRLAATELEAKLTEWFHVECRAVFTTHASIGADVDKPIDVVVAERVLTQR